MTFIDDYSRKLWDFVLKDQVLSTYKEYHARTERESRRKLKAVRTDNGGSTEVSLRSTTDVKI